MNWKDAEFDIKTVKLSDAQEKAWNALIDNLKNHEKTCQVLPAGAGAGKTYLMSILISSLLKMGCSPEKINSISFTNLSADELQNRVIKNQYGILNNFYNMSFGTIHLHAFNMLKQLAPHIQGLNVPYDTKSDIESDEFEGDLLDKRALKLSWFASIKYGYKNFGKTLEHMDSITFALTDLLNIKDHLELEDMIEYYFNISSRWSMDRFLSSDSNDVSYPIAVATEALLLINKEMKNGDIDKELMNNIGIPEILILDEAQDIDMLQLLYLRALNICGTNIIMVGDKHQTLYRWRQALGGLIFSKDFMNTIFPDTLIDILLNTPLNENWRSRKEILDFSHQVVKEIENLHVGNHNPSGIDFAYFKPIDEKDRGNMIMVPQKEIDKDQKAVSIICKETNKPPLINNKISLINKKELLKTDYSNLILKHQNSKLGKMLNKLDANKVLDWVVSIKDRIKLGETAVLIADQNLFLEDIDFLSDLINDKDIPVVKVSSEKCVALSVINTITKEDERLKAVTGIPLSHFAVSMAIHYILDDVDTMSGNQMVRDMIETHPNRITLKQNLIEQGYANSIYQYFEKMKVFMKNDLNINMCHNLLKYITDFTLNVIGYFGSIAFLEQNKGNLEDFKSKTFDIPYRLTGICGKAQDSKYGKVFSIRPANEQKRFFQWMWMALTNTSFHSCSFKIDYPLINDIIEANLTLNNIGNKTANTYSEYTKKPSFFYNDIVRIRENSFEAFSNIYNSSLSSWLRMIFGYIGTENIKGEQTLEDIMREAYDKFLCDEDLRIKKKLHTVQYNNKGRGLIKTFVNRNQDTTQLKRNIERIEQSFEISTIHASKGMEWDHVLVLLTEGAYEDKLKNAPNNLAVTYHDNMYVSMTRAKKTLSIGVKNDIVTKRQINMTDKPNVILEYLIYQTAKNNGLLNVDLDWGNNKITQNNDDFLIRKETNHSELEVAMKCGQAYDLEYRRNIKTMSLLPETSYPLFFHNIMSEIIASLSGQRFSGKDGVTHIAYIIKKIMRTKQKETEKEINILCENIIKEDYPNYNPFEDVIKIMIPGYLYDIHSDDYESMLKYYAKGLQYHLMAICYGSNLFNDILRAERENIIPLVEKTLRNIIREKNIVMPFQGIPDVAIIFPEKYVVYDYKSIPTTSKDTTVQKHISLNVVIQLTMYMGLSNDKHKDVYAEAIYVKDIGIRNDNTKDMERIIPTLQNIDSSYNFTVKNTTKHAKILCTHSFNQELYNQTGSIIDTVKISANKQEKDLVNNDIRNDVALCSFGENEPVKISVCMGCNKNKNCAKSKFLSFYNKGLQVKD